MSQEMLKQAGVGDPYTPTGLDAVSSDEESELLDSSMSVIGEEAAIVDAVAPLVDQEACVKTLATPIGLVTVPDAPAVTSTGNSALSHAPAPVPAPAPSTSTSIKAQTPTIPTILITPGSPATSHRSSRSRRIRQCEIRGARHSPPSPTHSDISLGRHLETLNMAAALAKKPQKTLPSSDTSSASRSTVSAVSSPDMQQQCMHQGDGLPWNVRGVIGVGRLLMAWIAAIYACPYEGCTFTSNARRESGYVIRPDRTCDFLEHWWVTHMKVTLKYRCVVPACNALHKLFTNVHSFRQHLQKHYPGAKSSDRSINGPVQDCLNDFIEHASDDPDPKLVGAHVRYPDNHVSARTFQRIQADKDKAKKAQDEKDAKDHRRAEKKKVAEEKKAADALARKQDEARRVKECVARHATMPAT